jgi:hypothetical protein
MLYHGSVTEGVAWLLETGDDDAWGRRAAVACAAAAERDEDYPETEAP